MLILLSFLIFTTPVQAASPLEMHCQMVFSKRSSKTRILPGVLVASRMNKKKFKIFDIKNDFYFVGELENRTLELNLLLVEQRLKIRSGLQGERLYKEMMEYFGVENIDVIIGRWAQGTNFDSYFRARQQGLSHEEAALQTWAGRQAARFGFKRVRFIEDGSLVDGDSPQVYVEFIR
jgi:hypothetical protein